MSLSASKPLHPSLATLLTGLVTYALVHLPAYHFERAYVAQLGGEPQRSFLDLFSSFDLLILPIFFLAGWLFLPRFLRSGKLRAMGGGALMLAGSYLLMLVAHKILGFFIYPFPFDDPDFLISYLIGNSGYLLVFAVAGALLGRFLQGQNSESRR